MRTWKRWIGRVYDGTCVLRRVDMAKEQRARGFAYIEGSKTYLLAQLAFSYRPSLYSLPHSYPVKPTWTREFLNSNSHLQSHSIVFHFFFSLSSIIHFYMIFYCLNCQFVYLNNGIFIIIKRLLLGIIMIIFFSQLKNSLSSVLSILTQK